MESGRGKCRVAVEEEREWKGEENSGMERKTDSKVGEKKGPDRRGYPSLCEAVCLIPKAAPPPTRTTGLCKKNGACWWRPDFPGHPGHPFMTMDKEVDMNTYEASKIT